MGRRGDGDLHGADRCGADPIQDPAGNAAVGFDRRTSKVANEYAGADRAVHGGDADLGRISHHGLHAGSDVVDHRRDAALVARELANNRFDLCTEGSSTVTTVAASQTRMHTFAGLAADTLYWVRLHSSSHGFSAWKPVRTLPATVSLELNSAGADGIYGDGDAIEVTATFDESVTVTGTPRIAFTLGTATKHLAYASGSPGTELVFTYTVASGDEDGDGIGIAANALENHGGSTVVLTSDGSTPAVLNHAAVAASASHRVDARGAGAATARRSTERRWC